MRVEFSAVSFGDVMLRRHVFRDRPAVAVPGYEVVGVVEGAGDAAGEAFIGRRVAAFLEYGGNARHALVPVAGLVRVPEGVEVAVAAAAVLNYATALGLVEAAGLEAGDGFVIHGATGGVGTAVLDVARGRQLRGIGLTRSPQTEVFGARMVHTFAPDAVAQVRGLSDGGVRAVFDSRAGTGLWRSRAMLAPGGRLVVLGLSSVARRGAAAALGVAASFALLGLFKVLPGKSSTIWAIDQVFRREPERVRGWVEDVLAMLARGEIEPMVGATLPLAETARAQDLVAAGAVVGKVVIDCR